MTESASSQDLRAIYDAAGPLVERWLDLTTEFAALRDTATAKGLDWGQIKALLKAQKQDARDESGEGKRVKKIIEKADNAAAYADMLGLGASENNYFMGRAA